MTSPCPPFDPKFTKNYGYDDERGDFRILMHDHVLYRFEIVSKLGKGSFGKVITAYDAIENKKVALKIFKLSNKK